MQKDKKNKHMELEDRIEIQECLCKGMNFKSIAQRIGKDPTTVSKEVKLHAIFVRMYDGPLPGQRELPDISYEIIDLKRVKLNQDKK